MKNHHLKDIFTGVFFGILSSALLGYLIALRLLNWNPRLWNNLADIFGVILFTTLLYAVLGLAVGIVFTLFLKIAFTLTRGKKEKRSFLKSWFTVYGILTVIFFILITIHRTRPGAHILIYDIPLAAIYVFSLLAGFWLIHYRIQRKKIGAVRATVLPLVIFCCLLLVFDLIATPKVTAEAAGDPLEIAEAVASPNPDVKVFLFGVDGAEWSIVDKLIAEGKMPVMKKLLENGSRLPLKSLATLKSPLIWTSMATGKLPEKHGIQDFGCFQFPLMKTSFIKYPDGIGFYRLVSSLIPQADMPVNSTIRRVEAIWNILSLADKTVGVFGWWATWPAETVNGIMVSDRFTYSLFNPRATAATLEYGQVYPPEMLNELKTFIRTADDMTPEEIARFFNLTSDDKENLDRWESEKREEWNPLYQLKTGYTAGETYFNAAMYLADIEPPDFLTIYNEGNDMVSHFFWQYMDDSVYPEPVSDEDKAKYGEVVPRFYCYWDSLLGEAIAQLDSNTNIFVVADHGFGPDPTPEIRFRGGEHQPYGVFLASGPVFKKGFIAAEASVLDLTPTLLFLYGLPLAEDMDGKVIEDIFTDEFRAQHEIEYLRSYETGRRVRTGSTASQVDDAIKDQLRSLGYVR